MNQIIQNAIAWLRGHTIDAAIAGLEKAAARLEAVVQREEQKVADFIAAEKAAIAAREAALVQKPRASRVASNIRRIIG